MTSHVLVLIAAGEVSDADAEAAFRAAGAGARRRLGPEACEADAPDGEVSRAEAARAALGGAVDAALVPRAGREKQVFVADMDSTMIGVECIDELADFAGLKPEISAITERAMQGELAFDAALEARVALLDGLSVETLERTFAERVRLNPGAAQLVKTMAARGAATALVSGGFTFFADRVGAAAGFALARANRLEERDGRLTGRVIPPIVGRETKAETLAALCAERGVSTAASMAVGDGANDLSMVRAAGIGAAYRAKPALAEAADIRLDIADLTALLHVQGVPRADWASA